MLLEPASPNIALSLKSEKVKPRENPKMKGWKLPPTKGARREKRRKALRHLPGRRSKRLRKLAEAEMMKADRRMEKRE